MLAEIYADLFDYPLTPSEARLWAIRLPNPPRHLKFIPRHLISLRRQREEISRRKKSLAATFTLQLRKIPTIISVFLTGSVAAGNAKSDADIDLLIITHPHTLWLTRLIIFSYLKLTHRLKNPICPNIFLDSNHLKITNQNLYTAHEVLQAQCLFDREVVESLWIKENQWTRRFLPNAYKHKIRNTNIENRKISDSHSGFHALDLLLPLEFFAFITQYLYMKPKITNEHLGLGFAFFHPRDLSSEILAKFNTRIKKV